MHLSDGVVSAPMILGGFAVAGGFIGWSSYRMKDEEIPQTAVMTAAFFVASLIHIPAGPTSVHLSLNGLVGILLRRRAFLAFPIGLLLQAALLGHGGLTVIGVNTCIFAFPALLAWRVFDWISQGGKQRIFVAGAIGGAIGVFFSGLLLALVLLLTRRDFADFATFVFVAHLPLIVLEAIITGFTVEFLKRVHPSFIRGQSS